MTATATKPSHREALIAAARELGKGFTLEALIVRAWERHPEIFGMREHHYPDTHRSASYVFGAKGLIARGHLIEVGRRVYDYCPTPVPLEPAPKPDPDGDLLRKCLSATAVQLARDEVTYSQARGLWNLGAGDTVGERCDDLHKTLKRLGERDPQARIVLHRSVWLRDRFDRRLEIAG